MRLKLCINFDTAVLKRLKKFFQRKEINEKKTKIIFFINLSKKKKHEYNYE